MKPSSEDFISKPLITFLRIYVESLTIVAVNCFILISGYFGLKLKVKSLSSFLFQVYFYSISIFILFSLFQNGFAYIRLFNAILPQVSLWFVGSYLGLLLLSPILNKFIENSDRKELRIFLLLFYISVFLFGYITDTFKFSNGYSPIAFVGLYLIGRYIRLYGTERFFNLTKLHYLGIYGISALFCTLLFCGILLIYPHPEKIAYLTTSYTSPFNIISSIALFMLFTKFRIQSQLINNISCSAFSVYLIHCDPNIVDLYCGFVMKLNDMFSIPVFVVVLICFVLFLFFSCVVIDKIRIFIWNLFWSRIKNIGILNRNLL